MQVSASSGSKEWVIPTPDNYPAVCIRIIDLGTQKNVQFNSESRKAKFVFELIGTANTFNEEVGPQPFVVSKEYTQSIGEKSNLRRDLQSWLNRPLTESELKNFDMKLLLGKPAFIGVSNTTASNGKTYATIKSITAPMKGFAIAAPVSEMYEFEIGALGWEEIYAKLWESDKKKIAESPEYKTATLQ